MTDAEGLTTTYTYDALGRVIAETKSGGGVRPDTTISTTYEGPAGLASPRWSCSYEDALGRTICETHPGFRGSLLVTSNEYNIANQLVATRSCAIEQSTQKVGNTERPPFFNHRIDVI